MSNPTVPYQLPILTDTETLARGEEIYRLMRNRRSVREFSSRELPPKAIDLAVKAAGTAPSGAHRQPWTFVTVTDPKTKHMIRQAAEEEEHQNYEQGRLPDHWLEALAPLGTGWRKPYLEVVPAVVVLFEQRHGVAADGTKVHNYYVKESVGIAAGLFITALHHMGIATLTHTPSPMAFLSKLLERPSSERPFALFPVEYPAENCRVPDLSRKPLAEIRQQFPA